MPSLSCGGVRRKTSNSTTNNLRFPIDKGKWLCYNKYTVKEREITL